MSNRALRQALVDGLARCHSASRQELLAIVDRVVETGTPVKFRLWRTWLLSLLLAALGLYLIGRGLAGAAHADYWLYAGLAMLLAAVIGLVLIWRARRLLPRLSQSLFLRALALDARVRDGAPLDTRGICEFGRGNYSNTVEDRLDCTVGGRDYQVFRYHYVDRREVSEEERNADGTTHTVYRTVYDHYDRHGFVTALPQLHGIRFGRASPGYRGLRWKAESHDYNQLFASFADSEMLAARFYKPALQLMLLSRANSLAGLSVEAQGGLLWVTVGHGPMLYLKSPWSFKAPEAMKAALAQRQDPPNMIALCGLVDELDRLTRDHFE